MQARYGSVPARDRDAMSDTRDGLKQMRRGNSRFLAVSLMLSVAVTAFVVLASLLELEIYRFLFDTPSVGRKIRFAVKILLYFLAG